MVMEALILDKSFTAVAVIDSYESFIWTDRYNAYGDFEIDIIVGNSVPDWIQEGYYLWFKESEHCMIIENLDITTDVENGNHCLISGRSLESLLYRRIIWGQHTYSGNFQNGIKKMLTECFISPSVSSRKVDNFIFKESTDTKITSLKIDTQYTGDCLYDVIHDLCEENGIGFKICLSDDNKFVFSLYAGTDRSYNQTENPYVIFSPKFGNLINSNYASSKTDYYNVTLVAGEGEGAERKLASVGSASGLDRYELFTDARDISSDTDDGTLTDSEYTAQLISRGKTKLGEHYITATFDGEVDAISLFRYGVDFFIGDTVQIVNGYGMEEAVCISELIFSNDSEGMAIYPSFESTTYKEDQTV